MVRRLWIVLFVVLTAAAPPAAGSETTDENGLDVRDATVTAGQTVRAAARRFRDSVRFEFDDPAVELGIVTANSDGVATLTFAVPQVPLGPRRLQAVGTSVEGGTLTVETTLDVLEQDDGVVRVRSRSGNGGVGSVPFTRVAAIAGIVGILLAVGLAKRRRSAND